MLPTRLAERSRWLHILVLPARVCPCQIVAYVRSATLDLVSGPGRLVPRFRPRRCHDVSKKFTDEVNSEITLIILGATICARGTIGNPTSRSTLQWLFNMTQNLDER